jgi:hypothetical protein
MSAFKKIWSLFTRKPSSVIDSLTEGIEEVKAQSYSAGETQIINDNFFYDSWEQKGSVIYNREPSSEVKRCVEDFVVKIY